MKRVVRKRPPLETNPGVAGEDVVPSSFFLGADPGINGALAAVDWAGTLLWVEDMPAVGTGKSRQVSPRLLRDLLDPHRGLVELAVIEGVHSFPGQGVSSSFKFGRTKGVIEGVVAGLGCPVVLPSPASWKRDMGLSKDKDHARGLVIDLFPEQSDLFKRVKDNDRAEAVLMALWGRRATMEERHA